MRAIPLLWALGLVPSTAQAGGYYYSDSGIVATGRGGAFIAGADTQFAQYYNPAGLIRIQEPTVNLGWSGVQQNVRWRQAKAQGGLYPEQRNQAAPFSVPQLGFVAPISEKVAFALGFISPFAPSGEWKANGPQRYNIIDSAIYQFGVGPSVAVQPVPAFTFGFGAQWSYLQIGRSLDLTILGTGFNPDLPENDPGGPDPGGDVFVDARAVDPFTPSFNLGLLIEPDEMLSIGASLTPPTQFTARGTLDVDFAGNAFESMFARTRYSDDVSIAIKLPAVVRAGVALRPTERLEVELAWVWQQWSSLSEIRIDDVAFDVAFQPDSLLDGLAQDGAIDTEVTGPFALPAGLRDDASYRLGAEYRFTEGFEGRLGGFYEPPAIPEELVTVSLVDTAKVQVGGGASAWFLDGRLRADAALAWIFFQDLVITDSEVKQVNAEVFPECPPGQSPALPLGTQEGCIELANTGNGEVSAQGWIVGLQLQYRIGKRP